MERLNKLMEYRQELANEEQSLKEVQKIIQKQINALEIENLHLESLLNKPISKKNTNSTEMNKTHGHDNDTEPKQLDLNVPRHIKHYEEEEEEDEDDEDL